MVRMVPPNDRQLELIRQKYDIRPDNILVKIDHEITEDTALRLLAKWGPKKGDTNSVIKTVLHRIWMVRYPLDFSVTSGRLSYGFNAGDRTIDIWSDTQSWPVFTIRMQSKQQEEAGDFGEHFTFDLSKGRQEFVAALEKLPW